MSYSSEIGALRRLNADFKYSLTNGDFPIDQAHLFIYNQFRDFQSQRLQAAKDIYDRLVRNPVITDNDRASQTEHVRFLTAVVDEIREWKDLTEYMGSAGPVVNEYTIISGQMYNMYLEGKSVTEEFQKLMSLRADKIRIYLSILSRYIPVYEMSVAVIESANTVKNNAGRKKKSADIDVGAFKMAILRFQGKQENKIHIDLFNVLDVYFGAFGCFTREHAATLPIDEKGRRVGTTFNLMIDVLKKTRNSGWYQDANLICHLYWGWVLPDISHLENKLIANFIKTQEVFVRIKDGFRSSSLNIDVLLRKHLQAVNFPCDREDFRTIKSPDICQSYQRLMERMFTEAGIPFIPGL